MATKDPSTLTLSPTKVDTFLNCRRLFKYRFIAPPFTPEENKYFLIGNIAHAVLENTHKRYKANNEEDIKVLLTTFFKESVRADNVKAALNKGIIQDEDLFSIRDMLKKYIVFLKKNGMPNMFMAEKLDKVTIGGAVVWLKSDRVDLIEEHTYKVVDYKSGKPATMADELFSVQIPSYGIWIRRNIDKAAKVLGEYQYLKFLGTKDGVHKHDITDEMMDKAEEKYYNVNQYLKNGCTFERNLKYKYCRNCDFSDYCRKDQKNGI